MYESYIGKTVGDHINGFKTKMNNHITKGRSGVSTCNFPFMSLIALKEIIDN